MALLDKAKAPPQQAGGFQPPDLSGLMSKLDPKTQDVVERVTAAAMKIMYSPAMRDTVKQQLQSQDPVPKKLADNATGLLLMMDKRSDGGIPPAALMPAGLNIMVAEAEALEAAGQSVSQDDFSVGSMMLFANIGKKLGGTDQDLMQIAAKGIQGGQTGQGDQAQEGTEPMPEADEENSPDDAMPGHEQSESPQREQQEDAGTAPDEEEQYK